MLLSIIELFIMLPFDWDIIVTNAVQHKELFFIDFNISVKF